MQSGMQISEQTAKASGSLGIAKSPGTAKPAPTLASLARDAVTESATADASVTLLLRRLKDHADLRTEALQLACRHLVSITRSHLRDAAENEYLDGRERGMRRHSAALGALSKLFDWPLPNSDTKLGDATAADLDAACQWHEGAAAGELRRAKMYRAVRDKLASTDCATVRDAMTEDEAAVLMSLKGDA